jgi:hypothetical protein
MIRNTLPCNLKEYYGEIEGKELPKEELLQVKNFWLFKICLYRLPDMYKVNGKDNPIYIYYFSVGKKRPTVQVTDILGGTMKYDEVKKKANTNYPIAFINAIICVLFKRWNAFTVCTDNKGMFNDGDTPENFQLSLKNVVYNNLQTLKFIKTLSTTDTEHIYSIGVSLGALVMAGVYGIEDSYKKAVIILCGYPLEEIIATSDEGMVRNFYVRMTNIYGSGGLQTTMIRVAIVNSNEVYEYIPKNSIMQIRMNRNDTSIYSYTQESFYILTQPKEEVYLYYRKWLGKIHKIFKNGHYQTLLYYPYLMYRTIKFLSKE